MNSARKRLRLATITYTRALRLVGLEKVWLVISEVLEGLVALIREPFVGTTWQRYKIHFMRNNRTHILVRKRNPLQPSSKLMVQPDEEAARAYVNLLMDYFESRFPKAIKALKDGLEDLIRDHDSPWFDFRRIFSTNMYERQGREIRRCSNVVGLFPSTDSYVRWLEPVTFLNTVRMGQLAATERRHSARFSLYLIQLGMNLRTTVDINSSFLDIRSVKISGRHYIKAILV